MDFELKTLTPARISAEKCDALIVLVSADAASGSDAVSKLAAGAIKAGDFEGKAGKLLSAYRPQGISATRVLLAGAGDGSTKSIRTAVHSAMSALKTTNVRRVLLSLVGLPKADHESVRAAVLACADACYVYSTTKSKPAEQKLQRVVLVVAALASSRAGFDKGVGLSKGLALTREWANRPANHATPTLLAQAAKELGKLPGIRVEVLGPKEVGKLGMGSFMAVAQGSEEPLRFIVLRYDGGTRAEAPVVLIGKGITFDTGGISIKPAAEMDEMKYDMGGAASVLGTFRALAELQPALNVVGLIPACENMPDGRAIKPGDVVTSMSGQTIEILNTDAEGRLVLCDALTYAERFKPRAVVDIATLTGACVIALGGVRSGMFSSDDALAQSLAAAGDSSLDLCWRMPLDDEYADGLKTHFADVANVAGRAGGAITAAKFLQRFASKFPWAHLDIAGTAWKSGAAKGSTGRPVPLLVDFLLSQVQPAKPAPKKAGQFTRMTEVAFHFNVPDKLHYSCRLIRKAWGSGARVVVTGEAETLQRLDQLLWTFSAPEFVPHCQLGAPAATVSATPVLLAGVLDACPHHEVLVNLGQEVPVGFERFERFIELVTPVDDDRAAARIRWKHYTDRGYAMKRHDLAQEARP